MTIQMLATWNGLEEEAVVTLASGAEEARLISLGLARNYIPGMDGSNPVLSNAQQAATQALVSGAGTFSLRPTARVTRKLAQTALRPLATGCRQVPKFVTYIDPVAGNDAWDGTTPAFVSGSTGPKATAMHSATTTPTWTGTKTAFFTGEILLFKGGTTYTHPDAVLPITLANGRHIGAYYTAQNQARPIIRSLNAGSAKTCIYASGDLSDISIQGVQIDCSDVANRSAILFAQTAVGQGLRNITIRGNVISGGTINDSTSRGAIQTTYYNSFTTTNAYLRCSNILIDNNEIVGYPGHGLLLGGAIGELVGQTNGVAEYVANGNVVDTQTITIAGITFTSVAAIGAAAGNFLIGASSNASLLNLAGLINAPSVTNANQVALSAGNQAILAALGATATVSGNILRLTLTNSRANAYLSETQTSGAWSLSWIQTRQIWGGVDAIKAHAPAIIDTREGDAKLLNGPKLDGDVGHASQDDIDALFN